MPPFEEKKKGHKKLVLALLKMRLPYDVVVEMSEEEAEGYIDAWLELSGEKKKKSYVVKRGQKG